MLYGFRSYWKRIFSILFSAKRKAFILCQPEHPNLGDQAQLMCMDKWIEQNYPDCQIFHLGYFKATINLYNSNRELCNEFSFRLALGILKLKMKKNDLILGHSGYFMVDHHNGWKMFTDMMRYFPNNRIVIFPQTVNFYTPFIKDFVSRCFGNSNNVILLCRDEISYGKAKDLFPTTPLLLYPDIVTSLIGTKKYENDREGVLFCMRNDIEAFYQPEQIDELMFRFGNIRKEKIDTTLYGVTPAQMDKDRVKIINDMIDKIATYKVVITDRYHGTIFSAIASTPVIVINSADHKLSSGVDWFSYDEFGDAVQHAIDLEDAYNKAQVILNSGKCIYNNPPYFKINYWDKLRDILES